MFSQRPVATLVCIALFSAQMAQGAEPAMDFTKEKVLYVVPYAHLDTQWRWTYVTTIDQFIKNTINDNLARFDKYPKTTFTFTGSSRYAMMQEYYPEGYGRVKELIKAGRWHVGGSSVDENDANIPSPESLYRQILYGNRYFQREFGTTSIDYMLPDCFGFQAHLPSVFAHAGLRGFSTQKLVWGLPFKIPFTVGMWRGPDGRGVIAALDGTDYTGHVKQRLDTDPQWIGRVDQVGKSSGLYVDYRYFGVGDRGGAPREDDIAMALGSQGNADGKIHVVLAGSDQMFRDLPQDAEQRLPDYRGDLLLREHSAGSITSQAAMKRWNRKNEQLAQAAEGASAAASWLGAMTYPRERLEAAWTRVLASQMHDIMPGTSLPKAYELSWNDEILALNQFAGVLEYAAGRIIAHLDTRTPGIPLVVYNPLTVSRQDVVEATVEFPGAAPAALAVTGPDGQDVPAQLLARDGRRVRLAFLPAVPATSWTVFSVRPAAAPTANPLHVQADRLENARYRVRLDANGDVSSIVDKANGDRELLARPMQLQFQYHKPASFPAWNMDWHDQQQPPQEILAGPADVRVVEEGPVRISVEVRRQGRNSLFTQRISLAAGGAGERVEVRDRIDWQGRECALKAAFPLTVANPNATYNLGLGVAERPTNHPDQYEVPHREWLDLTDRDGGYGVSILEDSKFGSDKPDERTLRLTLLYTPGVRGDYLDQYSQDWGRHDITYGLYGHPGDWRQGSEWQARRLNQPLVAFTTTSHPGRLGTTFSFCSASSAQVDVRALKMSEDGKALLVRCQELHGKAVSGVALGFPGKVLSAVEADAQERPIGPAQVVDGKLMTDFTPWSPKTFLVTLAAPGVTPTPVTSHPIALPFTEDVVSGDGNRTDGAFTADGRSYPAEQFPARVSWNGIDFTLGGTGDGVKNALTAAGQRLELPPGGADQIVLLAAATERVEATFHVDGIAATRIIPCWTGFIGQADNRVWNREFADIDYQCAGVVTGLVPGFIHREPVAWFAQHRHAPTGNEAYRFTYLFACALPLPPGAKVLELPRDPRIRIFAASTVTSGSVGTQPAAPLYDALADQTPIGLRTPPNLLTAGITSVGISAVDRKESWTELAMGAPGKPTGIVFRPVQGGTAVAPHSGSGVADGQFPRLGDGQLAQQDDDTGRCVWFDGEGRFIADLGTATPIVRVNTYSWHRSNRAPQRFTLWGANGATMPQSIFRVGKGSSWTLLASVDSSGLGQGGKHGSTVMAADGGVLGPFRWLLWIAELPVAATQEGTFFTEVSVQAAR